MWVLKSCSISLILSFNLCFVIAPAEAGAITKWHKWTKNKLSNSGITITRTYSPPKLPVSASCDLSGNTSASFSPGLRTPIGRFGITVTRKFKSINCGHRSH
jgi:hypothetical protein